jgi:alpha-galactosidase
MFWVDAYWTRDGFPAGMGHYGFPIERAEPRDRFPGGLSPIGEAAHKEGMGYLMWFEPERVHPGTALAKEHPGWVISPAGDGSGLFNLGIPEARGYMTHYLKTVVKEYGLDCLRIDYNIDPLPFWDFLNKKDPDRLGMGEIRYVEGLYRMWDEILSAHPRLFIDNCASGGRRIDLETCSRSIPLWRSDNTCDMVDLRPATILDAALKNQLMSAGLNRYLPFSVVGQMGAAPYFFRSGFNGGISFAEDCRPAGYPRDQLREAIAEAKRLRKYWFGDFFPLSEATLDPAGWCVLQYHRPAERAGAAEGGSAPALQGTDRRDAGVSGRRVQASRALNPGPPDWQRTNLLRTNLLDAN